MLSEEEIEGNELYKANYMQIPVTMLTKENLSKLEEHCKKTIHFERGIEHSVVLELLYKYRELETREQKLIEKLEKKIRYFEENEELIATSNENYSDGTVIDRFIKEFREILSILKGEKNE